MTVTKPKGFADLTPEELHRSALEDFAIPVDEADKGKKKVLLAAFVEGGVTWADYVAQHPEVAPEPEVVKEVVTETVTTTETVAPVEEEVVIRVAEAPKTVPNEKWLIKMTRDNLLFEVRGHRFTQQHPYALVSPEDAQYILSKEVGFRQALPDELAEFYG